MKFFPTKLIKNRMLIFFYVLNKFIIMKFKNQLKGDRLVLKRTKPTIQMAKTMFTVVDDNREHLKPWFSWEKSTLKVEDSLKYLFDKEEQIGRASCRERV